jgi:hypothetical protein
VPLALAKTGDGCSSPSVGRDPIVLAGAGIVGILRQAVAGSVHHATVETSPHFCVKNIFSRDSDQRIVANCLPVGYAPGAPSHFPFCQALKETDTSTRARSCLSEGVWPHRPFPTSHLASNGRSLGGRQLPVRRWCEARRQWQLKGFDPAKHLVGGRAEPARRALRVETGHLFPVWETPL